MNPYLLLILIGATITRLPYLADPYVRLEEWGMAQFSVYAANYHRFGYFESGLYPIFGKVGDQIFPYANHPPLASIMLGLWTGVFGNTEAAARILSILFLLGTVVIIYLMGKTYFDERIGLWSAGVYAFMPLSIYLARFYTMEIPQTFFTLVSLYFVVRWDKEVTTRSYLLALVFLVLGNACDIYPIYLSPAFLVWGLYDIKNKAGAKKIMGWVLLTATGSLYFFGGIAYLSLFGWARYLLVSGVSKYSTPWTFWIEPSYYKFAGERLLNLTGWVPAATSLAGLRTVKTWNRSQWQLMSYLISLPVVDFFLTPNAVNGHNYRIMHFLPVMAVLSALVLVRCSKAILAGCLVLFLGCHYYVHERLYQVLRPGTPHIASQIRELTTERDILIGLPPSLAYYVNRPAAVPYFFLWRHKNLYQEPKKLFSELHPLAEIEGYDRLVLFTQFLVPGNAPKFDWSQTFDGVPNLERVTDPGVDPQVWKKVTP